MLCKSSDDGRHDQELGDAVGRDVSEELEELELGHNVDWNSALGSNRAVQHLSKCMVETRR